MYVHLRPWLLPCFFWHWRQLMQSRVPFSSSCFLQSCWHSLWSLSVNQVWALIKNINISKFRVAGFVLLRAGPQVSRTSAPQGGLVLLSPAVPAPGWQGAASPGTPPRGGSAGSPAAERGVGHVLLWSLAGPPVPSPARSARTCCPGGSARTPRVAVAWQMCHECTHVAVVIAHGSLTPVSEV